MTTTPAGGRRGPRDLAVEVLTACYDGEAFALEMLDGLQQSYPQSAEDAGLAAELVLGTLRHRLTAEHLAAHFYRGRWAGLRPSVRVILAVAVYQLCWLDRVPAHAAVNQAVAQAKRRGRGVAATVNALLRRIEECRGDVIPAPEQPDPRRYLSIDRARGRLFAENVFPDPSRRPLEYLIAATSHSAWLVERWHRRFKPRLCRQICDAGQRRPSLVLRPNPRRVRPEELVERLVGAGHQARVLGDSNAVMVDDAPPAAGLEVVRSGLCQPQDSTSQTALTLSPPRPGELVVDLCAGVGTKSTQAAEMMDDEGAIIATDADALKLSRITADCQRLGLTIVQPVSLDDLDRRLAELGRPPDVVLVDAPCSNTGVLARRPEARYRASQRALGELVAIQAGLLKRAAALAGPATRLIYATCSLEREENEQAVEDFCEAAPEWEVVEQVFTLPGEDRDGGFAAVLRRRGG
jgi:16S rRNA (cytosine967-C5)-methyltransferase